MLRQAILLLCCSNPSTRLPLGNMAVGLFQRQGAVPHLASHGAAHVPRYAQVASDDGAKAVPPLRGRANLRQHVARGTGAGGGEAKSAGMFELYRILTYMGADTAYCRIGSK